MAIDRPEAIDDAPACRPQRSEGWRPGGFLVSRGKTVLGAPRDPRAG